MYKLSHVDATEEIMLGADNYPNPSEPITGWRRIRINYRNGQGHSNVEGTLYFPPHIDPWPIVDELVDKLNVKTSE